MIIEDEELELKKIKRKTLIGQVTLGILIVALWEILTRIGVMDSYYWSSPQIILQTSWVAITEGTLLTDMAFTSGATILGFILGTVTGAILGLSFWWSKLYSSISEPYLVAFNSIPKLALAPVIVILLGIGFSSKVILAFLMVVIVTALAAHSGVKAVDPDLEKMLFSLGAKRHQVFTKVVIPSSMPWIISSLKINIALALAGTIVGEFIASRQGVGRMISYAGQIMDIDLVWVGVVVLSLLSIVMYLATVYLEKLLLKGASRKI
ncbi:ABC transporter permease [Ureibacillus massiliensis 4400831 = CIP 108448 = CCUG 49529]|uniref:ABC transporter permease n=1 Tax=Ureibacillus massiliensis 4400831 = CIP 108448 = CCUG 49529 TaxID=1211035 RepID=A0A0A3J2T8_9BACL|nr:ABC transporter permease [Ureibacillus massiliensis 4400831 = CIP 108448 = CCUG 49529]